MSTGYKLGVYVNNGSWRNPYAIYVYNAGAWVQTKAVYVNDSGTWRQVYAFYPGINVNSTFSSSSNIYSGTCYYYGRDTSGAYTTGYFQYTKDNGWWTRAFTHQDSGGFNGDTGWVNGSSGAAWANQSYGETFIPTAPGSGNQSLFSVPTTEGQGYHYGGRWYGRWCYSGEVSSFNYATSTPSDWVSF